MSDLATAYAALAKAQANMGKALKNATNPHFRAKYADLGNVQDACLPALHANGFAVFQPTGTDDAGHYVKTIFAHESGGVLECRTPLLISKNDMQGLGSAITYARRYGLLCMSGLAPEDDDGNAAVEQTQRKDDGSAERLLSDTAVALQSASTIQELAETFQAAKARWQTVTDAPFPAKLVEIKDEMKTQLNPEGQAA